MSNQIRCLAILLIVVVLSVASVTADPIHDAVAQGNLKRVTAIVDHDPTEVMAADKDGGTPLHYAAAKGSIPILRFLIKHKADIDAKKNDEVTPLHVAAGVNSIEAAKELIAAGADINAVDTLGRTPLYIAEERGYSAVAAYLRKISKPSTVWLLDSHNLNPDERLTAVCLQGILNRRGARVYLNTGTSARMNELDLGQGKSAPQETKKFHEELGEKYVSCCDVWTKELADRKIFQFQPTTLDELIEKCRGEIKGIILYQSLDDDLAVAATMAGLKDAIPMTPAVYSKWVSGKREGLPTTFDVRDIYAGYDSKSSRRLEAHRWAIKNLFPLCNKNAAISRNKTYGLNEHDTLIDIDLGVQNKWITYDLSYLSSETKENVNKPDPIYGYDPPDKPILIEILSGLQKFSPVYGWGGEGEFCVLRRLTKQNCVMICTGTGNGSFYKKLPRLSHSFQQPRGHEVKTVLEQKVYVAYLGNEGDTLKCLASFENQGRWLQPERGKVAINWGMDPLLYQEFPGLVSYYYATATPNDYFFAAVTGWGYTHPDAFPTDSLLPYADKVREGSKLADLHFIDIWWAGNLRRNNLYYPFVEATGMSGVSDWSGFQEVEYSPSDGIPIVHSFYYYPDLKQPEKFANELIDEAKSVSPPWFIIIYGGTPHQFYNVATRLPVDKFKVVTLDEFYEAARQARSQIDGRTWKPANLNK